MTPSYILNSGSDEASQHEVALERRDDSIVLSIDGHRLSLQLSRFDQHHSELLINGRRHEVFAAQDGDKLFLHIDGRHYYVEAVNEFSAAAGDDANSGSVRAPMPGVVLEVNVNLGDSVKAGDTLMLIESMKLQTEIKASQDGDVSELPVSAGQAFDKGAVLAAVSAADKTAETDA